MILLAAIGIVIFLLTKKKDSGDSDKIAAMMERLSTLSEENKDLRNLVDCKLSETHKASAQTIKDIHSQSVRQIESITEKLAKLENTNKQVVGFSEQLKNLQDILQNSKQRGALGEYFLETTIKNVLPPESYEFQYPFKDGSIVDAVIKLPDGIVPVDSKFSLENYNKILSEKEPQQKKELERKFKEDLKNRIMETSKYIKPKEGTMDFAFMFIPSEGIYYDLLISKIGVVDSKNFLEYAFRDKKVIIVSPTTLHAYLQTVMQGLKSLKIEKQAMEIGKRVENLQRHIIKYSTYHQKLGNSISTVVNHYNETSKSLKQVSNDTIKITEAGDVIEVEALERPKMED